MTTTENNQILKKIDLIAAKVEQKILEKEEWQLIVKEWEGTEEEERSFLKSPSSNNNQLELYHYQSEIYREKNW